MVIVERNEQRRFDAIEIVDQVRDQRRREPEMTGELTRAAVVSHAPGNTVSTAAKRCSRNGASSLSVASSDNQTEVQSCWANHSLTNVLLP